MQCTGSAKRGSERSESSVGSIERLQRMQLGQPIPSPTQGQQAAIAGVQAWRRAEESRSDHPERKNALEGPRFETN